MTTQTEHFEDEYEEYDEFDEDEGERGLSGLVVLVMGVVMLCAFASVVWIAYQTGIKNEQRAQAGRVPTVLADSEPIKIENQRVGQIAANERQVHNRIEGAAEDRVEILDRAPEEPVARTSADPIGDIASQTASDYEDDAVADRIRHLAEADRTLEQEAAASPQVLAQAPAAERPAQPARPQPSASQPAPSQPAPSKPAAQTPAAAQPAAASGGALSGTHVVQVGAFRSQDEANGHWGRLQNRMSDYVAGKSPDIERADLGERGIFYRLRIGPFASADEARTYCEGLKTRGQDCLHKAK